MNDQDEIRALQIAYAKYFDARDADNYAALYTEDTTVTTPWGQVIRGRDKMRKAVVNTPAGKGWHKPGDTEIVVDGDDAKGVSFYKAMDGKGDVFTGRYIDTYRRTTEGWRIASRVVLIDEPIPLT